ncbi:hypothetical protein VPR01S_03_01870 [Vibrio proteolyticus NBRC 13287]|uniref:tRNA-uridine aminocarboxypropyltransferase n=2 Tax=Vibrionaceae TaxID=641 RepID=U2ZYW3_VIBPR|nr:hypothetical protein VPR01S_03_01870 [Vibrio proteolyticus NBRC 13287]
MGTARILSLSLPSSHHFIGEDFSAHTELNRLLSEPDSRNFVLYPSDVSQLVTQIPIDPVVDKVRVILLDGTWKKAYKMYQLSANLQALPGLHLPTGLKGNYRIRKAPSDNSLSTVEAGYHLLTLLEPDRDFLPLVSAFEQMVEFQIAQMPAGVFEKNYAK